MGEKEVGGASTKRVSDVKWIEDFSQKCEGNKLLD